ncbi:beta strand repeat-containing protein [Nitrosomonas oligotropha]|uniref:Filamentous hemagglutinin family N-terminal domain-containing protein n=1 Tax=Nitrosomonas oligotropha TaxID=42354 RepID=A0A1H8U0M7_9PROT|nr:filamentous hemagglutinin N-terminal domain-containing protein [Nitrosomonas oligotropha]SDX37504.1 filamentous hemagglutinin family N-terminal domain-containing protein [Nitrosomonas oligotropha]SEO96424.1 filamentous hemagglutinin family N-terminal domain-containing protein [Nitrosomonas oligotropha]
MKNYRCFPRINEFAVGIAAILLLAGNAAAVNTHIQTDGTLPGADALNINAPGSNHLYTLSEINGKLSGHNLFYSFSNFSIGTADAAWFNLNTPDLANVISRVTGGAESIIDGQLKMTNVGSAPSFFFINPAGITFNSGASVDVPSSFYVSTASSLNFSDGSQYPANETNTSSLSSANPDSFGFLGNEVGNLNLSGAETARINLNFKPGSEVVFVANQIAIINASISNADIAQAGLNLQIVATGKEDTGIKLNALPGQATSGNLTLQNAYLLPSGSGSGNLLIRSGEVSATGSLLVSNNYGEATIPTNQGIDVHLHSLYAEKTFIATIASAAGGAGNVLVNADTKIQMSGGFISSLNTKNTQGQTGVVTINTGELELDSNAFIAANASGGDAKNVNVSANSITLNNGGSIVSFSFENATGSGGTVTVNTNLLKIDHGFINTGTSSDMKAGDVLVNADSIAMTNTGGISSFSLKDSKGSGGTLTINARELELDHSAAIQSNSAGNIDGISIDVTADSLILKDKSNISVSSIENGKANLGTLSIKAERLEIDDGNISSLTASEYKSGKVNITTDFLKLSNNGAIMSASGEKATGSGGEVIINAGQLEIDHANIRVNTLGMGDGGSVVVNADSIKINDGGITANSQGNGTGNAGTVIVNAELIEISNAHISSDTSSKGNAGKVTVVADSLRITNEGHISTDSHNDGDAGSVEVTANSLKLDSKGGISSDASLNFELNGTKGNGGNVIVNAQKLELDDGSISSGTFGEGGAGSVVVIADSIKLSNNGKVTSETLGKAKGDGGDVILDANMLEINDGFISSKTMSRGNAGNVEITADILIMSNDGEISSGSGNSRDITATGHGGIVSVNTEYLDISNSFIIGETYGTGNAGQVNINVDSLQLHENGFISSSTFGSGYAGDITVTANILTAQGNGNTFIDLSSKNLTGVFSGAGSESSGQTGNININSKNVISFNNGAQISIKNDAIVAETQLASLTPTAINIDTANLFLTDSRIAADSNGNVDAGNINIHFADQLFLDPSQITTEATDGNGGAITIQGEGSIFLLDSSITTSVKGQSGNGGNIAITANGLILDSGFIQANTAASGASGGKVDIQTPALIPSGSSLFIGGNSPFQFQPFSGLNVIQAAAPDGVSGTISTVTPQLNLNAMMTNLAIESFDSNVLNRDMCEVSDSSSLLQSGRGAQPLRARDLLLSPVF